MTLIQSMRGTRIGHTASSSGMVTMYTRPATLGPTKPPTWDVLKMVNIK